MVQALCVQWKRSYLFVYGEMFVVNSLRQLIMLSFKILLCVAAVMVLAGCHGEDNEHENTSPSDVSAVSDSDYQKFMEGYVDTSAMSFAEIGEILGELGISVDDEVLKKAEYSWNKLDPDEMDFFDKVGFVLSYVGTGSYDSAKKTFTPASDKVFCFDLENGATDQSLEMFFEGLNAISHKKFKITDVKLTSVSKEDKKSGIYERNIKFKLNDKSCSYDAEIYYDWFDTGLISYINSRLAKYQISDNRLYFMVENQTCEVFYCSEEWAEKFADKTGCELRTETV